MKKAVKILSGISGLLAIACIALNIPAIFGGNWFIRFAVFASVKEGSAMGLLGNILGVLLMAVGFGAMCWYGFASCKADNIKATKFALASGNAMVVLSAISLIFSIAKHIFTFGDILILLFPLIYVLCVFNSVKD